jgi:hypothetical protein
MVIVPTAAQVRSWSDVVLDDHLRNCYRGSLYKCAGCTELIRRDYERRAIEAGVPRSVVEGWL